MSYKFFRKIFYNILDESPLPGQHKWTLQTLRDRELLEQDCMYDLLVRTRASFQSSSGDRWISNAAMILFRIDFNEQKGRGCVSMRIFGQKSKSHPEDGYASGIFEFEEVWFTIQNLLMKILCLIYERRPDEPAHAYIVALVGDPRYLSIQQKIPHPHKICEACHLQQCLEPPPQKA